MFVNTLCICALAGLVVTGILAFEEPDMTLLTVSSALLLMAIAAVFAHLGFTRGLPRSDKRIWLRQLTGRRAIWAWGDYLLCDNLHTAAIRFSEEASKPRPAR